MENNEREEYFEELKAVCKPVLDFLYKHHHPHTTIVIKSDGAAGTETMRNI